MSGSTRAFTLIASALFTAGGAWMIVSGDKIGWLIAIFFGLCFWVAVFEPWFPERPREEYQLLITDDEIACEHPRRKRESIRWADVERIWYVTNSEGPWLPDEWLLLEGAERGCSFPTEAAGFKGLFAELDRRFAGFDFAPIIKGGTDDAKHLCWERRKRV